MEPLLDVSDLTIGYGSALALDRVSLRVDEGEIVGVVGESGSGKTTLALAILGLLPPAAKHVSGDVVFRGTPMLSGRGDARRRLRGPGLSMVFQNPRTSFDPLHTIGDHLMEGFRAHGSGGTAAFRKRAVASLTEVELPTPADQLRRYPHELSGGMRQRSMIALALEHRPQLIVADEPTTALDVTIQAQILELMARLTVNPEGQRAALLLVSHNLGVVRSMCTRLVVMYAGRIIEQGPIEQLFNEPRHPYTRALVAASPRLREPVIDPGLPGDPVDITNLPLGCAFAPRCAFRLERCATEMPPLADIGGRLVRCWVGEVAPLAAASHAPSPSPIVGVTRDDTSLESAPPIVTIDRVSKRFGVRSITIGGRARDLVAVRDVSVAVRPGRTLGLVGESGSGKSTLGRLVLGLLRPSSGQIRVDGTDPTRRDSPARRQQQLQAVFQDPHSSLDPRMTVQDSIEEPLRGLAWSSPRRRARAAEVLAEVRLPPHFSRRYPRELSGGQAQRVAIARALAPAPEVIVLDEPTASLDVSIQAHVLRLLVDLQARHGLTYLFISHDLAAVRVIAQSVAVMYLGAVMEDGPASAVFGNPQHPYTVALLSAVPDIEAGAIQSRIVLSGEQPSPIDAPSGCPFRTRCPVAQARCVVERPELRVVEGGQRAACHFPGSLVRSGGLPRLPARGETLAVPS